ncbi:MAG: hypothetical protein E7575_04180 [Ruminococcaceae bacterium]|nr:hypothetical protein [Oscillospiraceae bacterium]
MKIDKSECICAFCENAVPIFDSDTVLCEKNGIVSKGYSCRHFSYDPLKRTPPRVIKSPKLDYIDINE